MSIDDEIKALLDQADALKAMATAEQALKAAAEKYRSSPTDKNKATYRQANDDMATARSTARAQRPLGVGGDAVASGDEG